MPGNSSLQDTIAVLAAVPILAGLDQATLQGLASRTVRREFGRGHVVFCEGEPCPGLLVVQEGWLKAVRLSPSGREQIVCVVGPGEVCDEIAVFAGVPNPATAIALEPATVLVIETAAMLDLLERFPTVARAVASDLARRALHMLTIAADLSLRTVGARLARLLLERAPEGELHRYGWATQDEIAARLGTVPDVLQRELKRLAGEGLIRVTRRQIQILDRPGLEAIALAEELPSAR